MKSLIGWVAHCIVLDLEWFNLERPYINIFLTCPLCFINILWDLVKIDLPIKIELSPWLQKNPINITRCHLVANHEGNNIKNRHPPWVLHSQWRHLLMCPKCPGTTNIFIIYYIGICKICIFFKSYLIWALPIYFVKWRPCLFTSNYFKIKFIYLSANNKC